MTQRWNVSTPTLFPELSGMIVYGDPSTRESMGALVARLEESLSAADPDSLDALRVRLILAGQLEQAVEDGLPESASACRALTDAAARRFVETWRGELGSDEAFAAALAEIPRLDAPLAVKLPEGFAFYGLYPEAYIVAALRWVDSLSPPEGRGEMVVVGVRSIGTTLSAVVAATLRAEGRSVRRLTVRPTGHPFDRQADLPPLGDVPALIVDEGPGLSGSSMAAVAEAAVHAGVPRGRIAFFPGHGGEPGSQASGAVRAWWREVPRFVVRTEELRWAGLTLEETLAAGEVEELSGGRWRGFVYDDPAEWPAVAMPFERRKLRSGGTLWKFVGLTVPGTVLGFASAPWVGGKPLRREDATPELAAYLGRYVAGTAGPPLSLEEAEAAHARLAEMLFCNLQEAGFPPDEDGEPEIETSPSSGDYRLAPQEWRRPPGGGMVKSGRVAPTGDHTVVGRQPVAWDVAGAMVEWGLEGAEAAAFLAAVPSVAPRALRFYRLAYAAFRMGMSSMCAALGDADERERLAKDEAYYRRAVERLLVE